MKCFKILLILFTSISLPFSGGIYERTVDENISNEDFLYDYNIRKIRVVFERGINKKFWKIYEGKECDIILKFKDLSIKPLYDQEPRSGTKSIKGGEVFRGEERVFLGLEPDTTVGDSTFEVSYAHYKKREMTFKKRKAVRLLFLADTLYIYSETGVSQQNYMDGKKSKVVIKRIMSRDKYVKISK
jgi:hypothetical protein